MHCATVLLCFISANLTYNAGIVISHIEQRNDFAIFYHIKLIQLRNSKISFCVNEEWNQCIWKLVTTNNLPSSFLQAWDWLSHKIAEAELKVIVVYNDYIRLEIISAHFWQTNSKTYCGNTTLGTDQTWKTYHEIKSCRKKFISCCL